MIIHPSDQAPIYLPPGEGRFYDMGSMQAIFKADEDETRQRFSISEWWLEPHSSGPGIHSHEINQDIFYVLEGTASIFIADKWVSASKGSFIMVPENIKHDFRNDTDKKIGLLNFFIPGGFEHNMAGIVKWYAEANKVQ